MLLLMVSKAIATTKSATRWADIGIAAANRQHAGAQDIRDRVRDVQGIAMVGNKSGKRISNCAPAIGQCEQHHARYPRKVGTIERSCDFLARNRWQVEAEFTIVGHGGCGSEARCVQDGLDTHSLRMLNALRHTCQLKFQAE